jgi:DNA polymerase III delta subunit
MIYILLGNDTKKKNDYIKKLDKTNNIIFLSTNELSKEWFFEQAGSVSLFGELFVFIVDGLIKEGEINFSIEDLIILKDSKTTFIFLEEKLLAPDTKKYKKYATIEDFTSPTTKKAPKVNVFNIAEAFAKKDKIGTWVLYRQAIEAGSSPEEISGILFWKIKTMILNKDKFFKIDDLKKMLSTLVEIYHKAHRGECDFTISLEQFILSSLSK